MSVLAATGGHCGERADTVLGIIYGFPFWLFVASLFSRSFPNCDLNLGFRKGVWSTGIEVGAGAGDAQSKLQLIRILNLHGEKSRDIP